MRKKDKNQTIQLGKINTLEIVRDTEYGYFLEAQNKEEVLLPNAYVVEDEMPIGSLLDVFVYTDSEDRLVATTQMPYAMIGEFGYFNVVDYESYGAFVDWGLPKDLFVPISQQKESFVIGRKYILRVCLDEQTGRLYGTQKIGKYFNQDMTSLYPNKKLKCIVLAKTPLGYKVVADNQYEGMLYNNEIYETLNIGDIKDVYVKKVRKDAKLDLSLQPLGKKAKTDEAEGVILKLLEQNQGKMPFTYKSDAQEIKEVFNMSKKNFKRTLTQLIESNKIELLDDSIVLL